MNQLDIDKINAQSPYKVEEGDEDNFFKFFTEHDVHYSVGFMPDDSLMQSERWFSAYSKKGLYTSVTSSVVDEDGITNYATIIVRNDNPRLVDVIAEFTTTISLLNQKP